MIVKRDDLFRSVCNIRTMIDDKLKIGTGTIFAYKEKAGFILSAHHIAVSTNENSEIIFSDQIGKPTSFRLKQFNSKNGWLHHPTADMSILPVETTPDIHELLKNRWFPYDHFHLDETPPSRDTELTTVGFPLGLGTERFFSPLTFRSFASSAMTTLKRFDNGKHCDFFLLEDPSIGGYSGGPVFDLGYITSGSLHMTQDKTRCHGIMHGTISEGEETKPDENGEIHIKKRGQLAAVTPSFYLKDLVERIC